jgi:pimeloyl-ACP methyl ester carboxylesterase
MKGKIKSWLDSGSFFKYKDLKIFYTQSGHGPDLLVIHGYPYSSYEWKECIESLAKEYKVTAIDLLGMGFSDKPIAHKYSYEEHCDTINTLLASLHIPKTHILSHDLGVSIVQELLAREIEGKNNFGILTSAFSNGSLFTSVYRPRLIQRLLSQTPKFIGKTISKMMSKNAVNASVKSVYGKYTQPSDELLNELWDVLNYNNGKNILFDR